MKITPPVKNEVSCESVMFADLSGSTALYENIGDEAAFEMVSNLFEMLKAEISINGGRLIKTIGDELMVHFPVADSAAKTAIAMQNICLNLTEKTGNKVEMRIGINSGPLRHEDNDIFGDTVNTAARLCSFATAGKIITSTNTIAELGSAATATFRSIGSHFMKGKKEAIECYEINWQKSFLTEYVAPQLNNKLPTLVISYGGRQWELTSKSSLSIGSGDDNDIKINSPSVSRRHAKIEKRKSSYSLVDKSTNGTLLLVNDSSPIRIHHEEHTLVSSGKIIFNTGSDDDFGYAITYKLA